MKKLKTKGQATNQQRATNSDSKIRRYSDQQEKKLIYLSEMPMSSEELWVQILFLYKIFPQQTVQQLCYLLIQHSILQVSQASLGHEYLL